MKILRRLHLYLGCFFAPLLLLYIGSGWYFIQFEARQKSDTEAVTFVQKLYWIHTKQYYPRQTEATSAHGTITQMTYDTRLFRWLLYGLVAGVTMTIALGVVMAFQTLKNKGPVWISLALGIIIPVLFLWLGQTQKIFEDPFNPQPVPPTGSPTK